MFISSKSGKEKDIIRINGFCKEVKIPRQPRQHSEFGYMHIMVRGNNKQIIFEDENDNRKYLSLIEKNARICSVDIIAYCLMENHAHILVYEPLRNISIFMKAVNGSYTRYFNNKYGCIGSLFQDRFLSKPINSEKYLLSVFRYILQNPQKSGICVANNYKWNSYKYYGKNSQFVNTQIIESYIPEYENYVEFINSEEKKYNSNDFLHFGTGRHNDEHEKYILYKNFKTKSGLMIKSFNKSERDSAILLLINNGMSIRQISRITGVGRHIISDIAKNKSFANGDGQ